MPKLSEILTSKELLESLDLGISSAADNDLLDRLDEVFQALEHRDAEMDKLMSLISEKNKLAAMIKSDIIARIKRESESWHKQCRDHSQIFTKHINQQTYQEHVDFIKAIYDKEDIIGRTLAESFIGGNSNWQGSTLLFRTADTSYLNHLLGFYPIYVIDKYKERYDEIKEQFPPSQMRKIRFYNLDDSDLMPKKAIKFIACFNHFTHSDTDKIRQEITMLRPLLSKGGSLVFNFNDCELSGGAKAFEDGYRSFVIGKDIREIAKEVGLNVISWRPWGIRGDTMVLLRDGNGWSSIKRAETLGRILEISQHGNT